MLAVPFTIWQATIDPAVDGWSTQRGLPVPELRDRGRGRQAVYSLDESTALEVLDRIRRQSDGINDAVLKTRTRSWVRKALAAVSGEMPPSSRPATRRRRGTSTPSTAAIAAVRHYLELVDTGVPPMASSGREESVIRRELEAVDERLEVTDDVLARLDLLAARRRLLAELEPQPVGTPDELEAAFVKHARAFAAANRYDAEVFLEFGVTAGVLGRAGLAPAHDGPDGDPSSDTLSA